jgi:hypothetical protein
VAFYEYARVRSVKPDAFTLEWKLDDIDDPSTAKFTIKRSESPEGPWTTLIEDLQDVFVWDDFSGGFNAEFRKFHYIIQCEDVVEGKTFDSEVLKLGNLPDAFTKRIIRLNEEQDLKVKGGYPVYFLPLRTWGLNCPVCGRRGKAQESHCEACYGTGMARGYFTPIKAMVAQSDVPVEKIYRSTGQVIEEEIQVFWTSSYPELKEDDVMVDAQNKRWKLLSGIKKTQKMGFIIRQIFAALALPRSHVIYRLPVTIDFIFKPEGGSHVWEGYEDE